MRDLEVDRRGMNVDVAVGLGPELDVVGGEGLEDGARGRLLVLDLRRQDLDHVGVEGRRQDAADQLVVPVVGVDLGPSHLYASIKHKAQ